MSKTPNIRENTHKWKNEEREWEIILRFNVGGRHETTAIPFEDCKSKTYRNAVDGPDVVCRLIKKAAKH